jgi:NAD(P)-dependent dehydrogenase (short-subunit alcohol dehydrogenase family)/quercetin dioxygenase-like cupin family protein
MSLAKASKLSGLSMAELRRITGLPKDAKRLVQPIDVGEYGAVVLRAPVEGARSKKLAALTFHEQSKSKQMPNVSPGVVHAGDVEPFRFDEGIEVQELLNRPSLKAASLATVSVPPGGTTALHRLRGVMELQLVVAGIGEWYLGDGAPIRAGPGDLVVIPKDMAQSTRNLTRKPLVLACFCTPRFDPKTVYEALGEPKVGLPEAIPGIDGVLAVVPEWKGAKRSEHRGKVAVVTGGSRGIGFEACRQLGAAGFTVVLTARDPIAAERAARELRAEGLDVVAHPLDVTSEESTASLARFLSESPNLGKVDVLINNAGVCVDPPGGAPIDPDVAMTLSMETNVHGPRRVTRHLLPLLERSGSIGRLINLGTEVATGGWTGPDFGAYAASKSALHHHTRALAKTASGIAANCVDPGWVKTSIGGDAAPFSTNQGVQAMLWLATCEDPPNGSLVRRATDLGVPPGQVAIEIEAW